MCSLLLADMGADVLKIEPPQGDEIRALGPPSSSGRSVYFDTVNAGKHCSRLNLREPSDKDAFLALARDADIVLESFRPGTLDRLGVGYEALRQINPGIILCSLSGYGAGTPQEALAGHDANYLAAAGVLDRNRIDGKAHYFEPPIADSSGALFAAIAVLGALRRKEKTGEGCHIEAALADAAMPLQMLQIAEMKATAQTPQAEGLFNGGAAYYNIYRTSDGLDIVVGAVEPKFWRQFCTAAGRSDWIARQTEPLPQRTLRNDVADFFARIARDVALRRFAHPDCCVTPVLDLQAAIDSEYVQRRGLVRTTDAGQLEAAFPVTINGQTPRLRAPLSQGDATFPSQTTKSNP
jgi:crotonobetainyl-CoA:carnitine CoA-transferase CaiB-like acyl-CoA transferase